MPTDETVNLPATGSLEDVIDTVLQLSTNASSFGIWIPLLLTWHGEAVTWNAASIAIHDALHVRGFVASRTVEHPTGRFCVFDPE